MVNSSKTRNKKRKDPSARFIEMFRRIKLNYIGVVVGLIVYFIALTPSLMPRPAVLMGVVAGVGFALGYSIGVLVSHVVRVRQLVPEPTNAKKHRAWLILVAVIPVFILLTSYLARYWQNEQRVLLELPEISDLSTLTIVLVALVIFTLLVLIKRGLVWAYDHTRLWVGKLSFLSPRVATITAIVVASFLVVGILSGILQRTAVVALDGIYSADNNFVDPSFPQPESELRSGSPDSEAAWMDLGREGRRFVSSGPDAAEIAEFTGKPAKEPIRAYAGLNNADDIQAQVELVMEELERTKAFDRKMLMVVIPTGSGWVEAETVAAFEYMHGGDTAIVSTQYSYLPSALALFLDRDDAIAMSEELLHAIENKLHSLPSERRPKLVAYGLSLGSFAGQADFTGEKDFDGRLDAALFVGTPGFTEPWRTITGEREEGTPQIEPIYNDEKVIKFAGDSDDLIGDTSPEYKIVYFQYATDPIMWFDGELLYREPDWMREEPGRGVSPNLHWFPIVSGAQIAIDQMFALSFSNNNGHEYSQDTVAALAAATKPSGWSAEKSRDLQAIIKP